MPLPFAAVFQPAKVKPARVKAFAVNAVGALSVSAAMLPVPPFALKVTVALAAVHCAYRVVVIVNG